MKSMLPAKLSTKPHEHIPFGVRFWSVSDKTETMKIRNYCFQAVENKHDLTNSLYGTINLADPQLWFVKYSDFMFTYAFAQINDAELARDLVQETFLAALEKIDSFEGKCSERTWLCAILKNKVIDVYRKRSSSVLKKLDFNIAELEIGEFFDKGYEYFHFGQRTKLDAFDLPDSLIKKEFNLVLQECLESLPKLWSDVFIMKYIDQESTKVICHKFSINPSNFWIIIHRAKIKLRKYLWKKGFESFRL